MKKKTPEPPAVLVPTTYTLQMPSYFNDIHVEATKWTPMDGPTRTITTWAVRRGGFCWTKRKRWEYEPMSSSRTTAFLKRARYDTLQKAAEAAQQAKRWDEKLRTARDG